LLEAPLASAGRAPRRRARPALSHSDLRVRQAAYEKAASLGHAELYAPLVALLAEEPNPKGKAALLVAIAASGEDNAFDEVSRYLDSALVESRLGAIVGLLRYGGLEGAVAAGDRLLRLLRSGSVEDRVLGARVLGDIADSSFYRGLVPLFSDSDLRVRRTAVWAAGKLKSERLWPYVIEALSDLGLRPIAIKSLLRGKEEALPAIFAAYRERAGRPADQRPIVRLLGRIGVGGCAGFLQKEIRVPDRGLRREVLLALRRSGYHAPPDFRGEVGAMLEDEVGYAAQVLAAHHDLDVVPEARFPREALVDEIATIRERIFLLLSFLYPADVIGQIEETYRFGAPDKRSFAIELFDNAVSRAHKTLVLPLLDDLTDEVRLRRLEDRFPQARLDASARLTEMAEDQETWKNPWLRLCARHAIAPAQGELSILAKVQALRAASIFSRLHGELLYDIAMRLEDVDVAAEEQIISRGDLGTAMYFVARGEVRVHVPGQTLAVLGPGDVFGELSALTSQPRTASVTANEKSHLYKLEQEAHYELIAGRIEIAQGICAVLCQRLRKAILRESMPEIAAESSGVINVHEILDASTPEGHLGELDRVIVLKTASIFQETPSDVLAEIAARTELLWLDKGDRLFRRGDVGTALYIVVDGLVKVHDGEREIVRLGARAVLGELAAISSEPRTATVTALAPTRLLALDQASLYELMWSQVDVVHGLMEILVSRLARFAGKNPEVVGNTPLSLPRGGVFSDREPGRPSFPA